MDVYDQIEKLLHPFLDRLEFYNTELLKKKINPTSYGNNNNILIKYLKQKKK